MKKSPSLLQIQRAVAGAVMQPLTRNSGMKSRDEVGHSMRKLAGEIMKPNDRLTSFERLEIYNRQYWFRVLDSLYEDFPGLRSVVGESRYQRLARAYLEKYPSRSFTLRNLGSRMGKFLKEEPRWAGSRQEVALDMVSLEWAAIEVFDSMFFPPLTPGEIQLLAKKKTRMALQPCVKLIELNYPLDEYLIACKEGKALRLVASNAVRGDKKRKAVVIIPRLTKKKIFLVVHQFENSVYYKRLSPEQFAILKGIEKGFPLGKACLQAVPKAKKSPEAWAEDIQQWFGLWAQLGWFCKRGTT